MQKRTWDTYLRTICGVLRTPRLMRSVFGLFVLVLALAATSCGGGGGPTLQPTLSITWGDRTRDVTAPTSALSVEVGVTSTSGKAIGSVVINRLDKLNQP